jgi:hypothetical protein
MMTAGDLRQRWHNKGKVLRDMVKQIAEFGPAGHRVQLCGAAGLFMVFSRVLYFRVAIG